MYTFFAYKLKSWEKKTFLYKKINFFYYNFNCIKVTSGFEFPSHILHGPITVYSDPAGSEVACVLEKFSKIKIIWVNFYKNASAFWLSAKWRETWYCPFIEEFLTWKNNLTTISHQQQQSWNQQTYDQSKKMDVHINKSYNYRCTSVP